MKALRVKTYQIKELMQKLVLTILHFPTVRILWSATSTDTAVMFGQLKDDQDEPVLSEAQAINAGNSPITPKLASKGSLKIVVVGPNLPTNGV